MKQLLSSVALLALCASVALAQPASTNVPVRVLGGNADTNAVLKLMPAQAASHIGARAIVTGKVAEVNKAASVVRLNFDNPFPDQTFTAVIFSRFTNQFSNLEALKGKQVEVSGRIMLYHSRPEIQLQSTNQLKVLDSAATGAQK